jgi:tetratricopeptide (TPR) repeat protein
MAKDIFFSYGHDEYKEFVLKVKDYLENEGFDVFVDSDKLRSGDDWEYKLEQEIIDYDKVLFFITPHAARRPDGYCLNEIAMALAHNKKVFPIMIKNHILPLSLIRKQFLDMQSCVLDKHNSDDSIFKENMKSLVEAIKSNDDFEHGDIQAKVIKKLEPIDFQINYAMHGHIVGREWIMDKVNDWLENNKKSKVLWIIADAGYGKSAISAYLARHPKVMNVHFCDYKGGVKNKPENVIKTLAYSIQQQQINGYLEEIEHVTIDGKKAFELFEELITNPLSRLKSKEAQYIFVIDGLDETLTDENRELVNLLGSEEFQWGLPDFIKIIITSRPDPRLRQALSRLNPLVLDTKQTENREDCKKYIKLRLSEFAPDYKDDKKRDMVDIIMKNSDANMLYLTKFFEQVNLDLSNPNKFPKGLDGIYMNFFRRITIDIEKYDKEFSPMLEVMLAYKEAIPKILLQDILGINRKKLHRLLGTFGSMIRENDKRLELYHKSLNDWLISEENEDYFVDIEEGNKRLDSFMGNLTPESYKEEYLELEFFNQMLVDNIYAKDKNLDSFFELVRDKENMTSQIKLFNNLGANYNLINQTQKAIFCLEYVLKIEEKLIDSQMIIEPSEYNKTLEKLSILYWKVNRINESISLRKKYIDYTKKLYEVDDDYARDYSKALYLLSSAYVQFRRYDEAEKLRRECLEIRAKFYEINPKEWVELYTTSLLGIAGIYRRTQRHNEAIPLGNKVIELRANLYKEDPVKWANSYGSALQNMAIYYSGIGNDKKALELSSKTVDIKRKLFQDNPARHAASFTVNLTNLSIYHNNIGEHQKALALQKECLEIREKFYLENADRWTAYYSGILKHIGVTYRHLGNLDKSIKYMEKGLELRKIVYDKAPDRWIKYYADALASLARTYRKSKDFNKALDVAKKALNIRKKQYLENHDAGVKKYVLSLDTMSMIYIDLNELNEANKYAQLSYELSKKIYMQNNTARWKKYYATSLITLAKTIEVTNNAISLMEESVELRKELYDFYGSNRKEFYLAGLKELAKLYENESIEDKLEMVVLRMQELR